jgi:putative ABC transport system permease protein
MGVTWRKVWRDLVGSKARTLLVVLSTAVGVFALGAVFGLSGVLRARIMGPYREALPAHITFWGGPFDQGTVDAIAGEPGIAAAEGELHGEFEWKLPGAANDRSSEWRDADLVARADFAAQQMNVLRLREGRWPDDPAVRLSSLHALAVECLSAAQLDIPLGSAILVKIGERERTVPIEGVVCAPVVLPPEWGGNALFYATPETAAWLSGSEGEDFNQLNVLLDSYSKGAAVETAGRAEERLKRMELAVGGYEISDPNRHWVQDIVDAVMMVLMVIGVLSLGVSAFLIINTMNAILVQQVWQIGVMKAVGATLSRVMEVYLATALIYGGLALLLAVPLGVLSAHWMAVWLLHMFSSVELNTFQFEPMAVFIQLVVGVAVPLLAALVPVIGGVRITIREAISSHGIGMDFGQGILDRLISRVRRLPRPVALSLRNTFRRKARIVLTLATLTFSGLMFTMVLSTAKSLDATILTCFSPGEDIAVTLDHPIRASRAVEIAESVPGVTKAEVWRERDAALLLPGAEEKSVGLIGAPSDSAILAPNITAGRSLQAGDSNALVFTTRLADKKGIRVGDEVTLNIDDEESTWTVVGLYLGVDDTADDFFVPLDALEQKIGDAGRGKWVKILARRNDLGSQKRLVEALEGAYATQRIEVESTWTTSAALEDSRTSYGILTSVLLAMVTLTAIVGGIGLMSTMSMNVVERRREIGVMRAIGASSFSIVGMFVVEGMLVGALSWLLAAPLSYPAARVFSDVIGQAIFVMPLNFVYAADGLLLWLLIVSALSALASFWPALQATKVSVREALAYE